jgi:predicted lysophospholipase L1 biosynthesis ABC-type transport system permease subunit
VNQSFVERVLGGRNPIGRRVRYVSFPASPQPLTQSGQPGPWYEIVGLVGDLGTGKPGDPATAGIYLPLSPGTVPEPLYMALHVRGDPSAFASRLRGVASSVDPALRVDEILPMAQLSEASARFIGFWVQLSVLTSAVAMILSLAGIYAVMSFTVARRTREIGIRVALGANARRVVASIFRRPLTQVGVGVGVGGVLAGLLLLGMTGGAVSATGLALLLLYAALMLAVCLLACVVPTRRALAVEPVEALRAEG